MFLTTNGSSVRGDGKLDSSSRTRPETEHTAVTEDVATAVVEQSSQNVAGVYSVRPIARHKAVGFAVHNSLVMFAESLGNVSSGVINRTFRTSWPPRSPGMHPCDF